MYNVLILIIQFYKIFSKVKTLLIIILYTLNCFLKMKFYFRFLKLILVNNIYYYAVDGHDNW